MLNRKAFIYKKWLLPTLVSVALGAGATLFILANDPEPGEAQSAPQSSLAAISPEHKIQAALQTNQAISTQPLAALPKPGPLPASLQGSSHDVRLKTDAAGNLVVEAGLLHLFEFYLSAMVEEPLETILGRINFDLADQLKGPALEQARDLLKRYIDYKIALVDLENIPVVADDQGSYSLENVAARQQQLQTLRQTHFSAVENAEFFQEENIYDSYMMQHVTISQSKTLSDLEKQQALERLELQLPEPIRAAREQATKYTKLYETTEQLKQQGAGAEELFQIRARKLGEEAAANLARLDQEQAEWDRRLANYAKERDSIRNSGLGAADQELAINTLIEQRFRGTEQLRVKALDPHL